MWVAHTMGSNAHFFWSWVSFGVCGMKYNTVLFNAFACDSVPTFYSLFLWFHSRWPSFIAFRSPLLHFWRPRFAFQYLFCWCVRYFLDLLRWSGLATEFLVLSEVLSVIFFFKNSNLFAARSPSIRQSNLCSKLSPDIIFCFREFNQGTWIFFCSFLFFSEHCCAPQLCISLAKHIQQCLVQNASDDQEQSSTLSIPEYRVEFCLDMDNGLTEFSGHKPAEFVSDESSGVGADHPSWQEHGCRQRPK